MPVTGDAPLQLDDPGAVLFCGAPQPFSAADFNPQAPWSVQFLPIADTPPPRKRQRFDGFKSNGCGTRVHNDAIPNNAMWRGLGGSMTDVVLPLDDKYVPLELKTVMERRREGCGCMRNPTGCAVCGNPLGVLTVHCTVHTNVEEQPSVYNFLPSAVSPPMPVESSPRTRRVRRPPTPTPRIRDARTLHPRRFTRDHGATTYSAPVRRVSRRTVRAMEMDEEQGVDGEAQLGEFPSATRSVYTGRTARGTELLMQNSHRQSLGRLLSRPAGDELLSYYSVLWVGPSRGFIPGRREVRPTMF
ncbi:hypothetical protein B0H14DRAFT_2747718 [Mycena olivaceomarginata]|nr:hypothetical protein B0H14DRAFT_2747718 [Mycena olivaceomarginata]